MRTKIYIATDHAGLALKDKIKAHLVGLGYEVKDFGAHQYDQEDDYPDFVRPLAEAVSRDPENITGIILGGTGQGEAMVANRFKNVRAAVFYGAPFIKEWKQKGAYEIIELVRQHNNANVLSLGARFVSEERVYEAVKLFLETKFSSRGKNERHLRRIKKIDA